MAARSLASVTRSDVAPPANIAATWFRRACSASGPVLDRMASAACPSQCTPDVCSAWVTSSDAASTCAAIWSDHASTEARMLSGGPCTNQS